MESNRYLKFWLPIIGLHALHQLEESISFFQWYIEFANKIPKWLLIQNLENANTIVNHPEYFILASFAQLFFVSLIAFVFRHKEKITKYLIIIYLFGLSFFLVWHILISYVAHSYAPIMVTCFGGLYLIAVWVYKLFNSSNLDLKL
jgi:hypothetical protein